MANLADRSRHLFNLNHLHVHGGLSGTSSVDDTRQRQDQRVGSKGKQVDLSPSQNQPTPDNQLAGPSNDKTLVSAVENSNVAATATTRQVIPDSTIDAKATHNNEAKPHCRTLHDFGFTYTKLRRPQEPFGGGRGGKEEEIKSAQGSPGMSSATLPPTTLLLSVASPGSSGAGSRRAFDDVEQPGPDISARDHHPVEDIPSTSDLDTSKTPTDDIVPTTTTTTTTTTTAVLRLEEARSAVELDEITTPPVAAQVVSLNER